MSYVLDLAWSDANGAPVGGSTSIGLGRTGMAQFEIRGIKILAYLHDPGFSYVPKGLGERGCNCPTPGHDPACRNLSVARVTALLATRPDLHSGDLRVLADELHAAASQRSEWERET